MVEAIADEGEVAETQVGNPGSDNKEDQSSLSIWIGGVSIGPVKSSYILQVSEQACWDCLQSPHSQIITHTSDLVESVVGSSESDCTLTDLAHSD